MFIPLITRWPKGLMWTLWYTGCYGLASGWNLKMCCTCFSMTCKNPYKLPTAKYIWNFQDGLIYLKHFNNTQQPNLIPQADIWEFNSKTSRAQISVIIHLQATQSSARGVNFHIHAQFYTSWVVQNVEWTWNDTFHQSVTGWTHTALEPRITLIPNSRVANVQR